MTSLAKKLGTRIATLRKKTGVTAEKFAYENGISKGYLSDIESGKRLPTLLMVEKIAKALSVEIKDLFHFK